MKTVKSEEMKRRVKGGSRETRKNGSALKMLQSSGRKSGTSNMEVLAQKIAAYIESDLRPTMRVKEIQAALNTDSGNLVRSFRCVKGTTIKKFIDDECKKMAERHLQDRSLKGYEIGANLGFKDDLAFYRWIRRVYGIPLKEVFMRLRVEKEKT